MKQLSVAPRRRTCRRLRLVDERACGPFHAFPGLFLLLPSKFPEWQPLDAAANEKPPHRRSMQGRKALRGTTLVLRMDAMRLHCGGYRRCPARAERACPRMLQGHVPALFRRRLSPCAALFGRSEAVLSLSRHVPLILIVSCLLVKRRKRA